MEDFFTLPDFLREKILKTKQNIAQAGFVVYSIFFVVCGCVKATAAVCVYCVCVFLTAAGKLQFSVFTVDSRVPHSPRVFGGQFFRRTRASAQKNIRQLSFAVVR